MATPIPQNEAYFSLESLLTITSGTLIAGVTTASCLGVATDTRETLRGKAFVALRGETFDGHSYLERAAQAGASVLVVDRFESETLSLDPSVCVVQVADTLVALGDLAAAHRARWDGKLIAVVGSAGKTTTRSVISSLLEEKDPGRVHSTVGNLNNRIGVPMVLFGLSDEHHWAVVELGTNCPGEVAELGRIARPDVAVLTLIDLEHTEGLGDLDGVEREESAIFSYLSPEGTAIGFGEDERVLRSLQATGGAWISYGFSADRQLRIVDRRLVGDQLSDTTLEEDARKPLVVRSPLVGRPGALAVAAGVCAAEALLGGRLSADECERALRNAGEPGRNQVIPLTGGRLLVDDTYNSNPASVENSISTGRELAARTGGGLWLVLGEMLELGELSAESHRQMGEVAGASGARGAFFVQGDARLSAEVAQRSLPLSVYFQDAAPVVDQLAPLVAERDVVVVKASRGVRAERVVQGLKAFYKSPASAAASPDEKEGGSPS